MISGRFSIEELPGQGQSWLTIPRATTILVFALGPPLLRHESGGGFRPAPAASVVGLHRSTIHTHTPGVGGPLVQVEVSPLTAYRALGVPQGELADGFVDLAAVCGDRAGRLWHRLAEQRDPTARFGLLDQFLRARLPDGPEPAPEVGWAWRRLRSSHGTVRIAELAAEVGWSRRHLDRRFRDQIGQPPKTVARTLRLQRAIAALTGPRADSPAAVAEQCGYYDQAHLNRDFRDIVGMTPTQYLGRRSGS